MSRNDQALRGDGFILKLPLQRLVNNNVCVCWARGGVSVHELLGLRVYWASSRPRGAPWSLNFTCANPVLQEWKLEHSHPVRTAQFKSHKLAGSVCSQTFPSPCILPPAHKCIPYFSRYGSAMDADGGAPPRLAASLASGFQVLHGGEQQWWKLPDLCGMQRCPNGGCLFHHLGWWNKHKGNKGHKGKSALGHVEPLILGLKYRNAVHK